MLVCKTCKTKQIYYVRWIYKCMKCLEGNNYAYISSRNPKESEGD